ncbi:hypothetical protein F511_20648 [Dorcoceras hygrometricum]|uniref:Dystroglycan-like n=1 Tax=Dorcoceras hygrometricum TaxID=472368 RepID=A0A2Z7CYX6_9LAMI|nr:hypothetical protein F511_20648 [Dorcoceras hygrometricum]
MASTFIANSYQVNFDSVLFISDHDGMLNMFKALEASGLRGFLGCESVVYEKELEQFFDTALIQDGDITGAVSGKFFSVSQARFAEIFGLPMEGLVSFSDVPKHLVYKARNIFSQSGEQVSIHGKKRFMKHEYRLLNDILAKSITVKAGSFDAITNERFMMMTAIHFGLMVKWSKVLFGVLKDMVYRMQKKAKGYAAQIGVLLKSIPAFTMGEAVPFPPSKIMSITTVNTYIAMNHTIDARGQSDEPGVADVVVVKRKSKSKKKSETTDETPVEIISEVAGLKKRPADEDSAPVIPKKRRTVKGKSSLDVVPVAQDFVPMNLLKTLMIAEKHTDEIDDIIGQIIVETSKMGSDEKEQEEQQVDETDIGDDFDHWLEESFKDFVVMTDVVDLFLSFSLNKLPDFDGLRDLNEKEKLMLSWAETEFLETAVKRRISFGTAEGTWIITDRPSSSQLFKDLADNSGAVLAKFTPWPSPHVGIFQQGVYTDGFVGYFSDSDVQSIPEFDSTSSDGSKAQRIEEGAKRSSRCVKSAAKQLTNYHRWMSTAELNSKWRKRQKPAKEKDTSTVLLLSVTQLRLFVHLRSLGVLTAAGCGIGSVHAVVRSNLLVEPSEVEEGEIIGYPRMSARGESSTTMHRIQHASGSHPIPTPYDPKTNQYNQDLELIHSTNGNHLESPNEGSSIDHQVTIYLHAQNITMFPTNETWYFASKILVWNSGGLILILMAQSTRNMFRIHSDY